MTVVEEFSALTVPLRVDPVPVVPLAAFVVATGANDVVKLSTEPYVVPTLFTALIWK